MTPPQRRALAYLATVQFASPAEIGGAMDDGTYRRGIGLTAQGAGRVGGAMAARLVSKGWVVRTTRRYTAYAITQDGRKALEG